MDIDILLLITSALPLLLLLVLVEALIPQSEPDSPLTDQNYRVMKQRPARGTWTAAAQDA
jgi:hypothetical protein